MKKRRFATLMCVIMVMMLWPATAFAANATSVWIWGKELTSDNPYYHNGDSGALGTVDDNAENYNAYFDAEHATLIVKSLDVRNSSAKTTIKTTTFTYALFADGDLTIDVRSSSDVSTIHTPNEGANAALLIKGNLSITGEEKLFATAGRSKNSAGVYILGNLDVSDNIGASTGGLEGVADAGSGAAAQDSANFGVNVTGDITVSDGSLRGSGSEAGASSCGIYANGAITISGGVVRCTGGSVNGTTGYPYSVGLFARGITVSGGTLLADGSDNSGANQSSYGIWCGYACNLAVSGGTLTAVGKNAGFGATSFGIYGSGSYSISVTGGSLVAKTTDESGTRSALQKEPSLENGITAKGSTSSDGSNPVTYVSANNASYMWVSVPSTPTVTSVRVNPATVSVLRGGSQTFNATVLGANKPAQTVNWAVEGGVKGTGIDAGGKLTVAANETAATLTIKATSTVNTAKSGTTTVKVITRYEIIQGQNGRWTKGGTNGLGLTANGDYGKFTGVAVDDTDISDSNYTSQSGSTIVTLKALYLETLRVGRHTLRISFTDGYVETFFTVQTADVPATGDSAQPVLWLGVMLLACAGLSVSVIRQRRQNG